MNEKSEKMKQEKKFDEGRSSAQNERLARTPVEPLASRPSKSPINHSSILLAFCLLSIFILSSGCTKQNPTSPADIEPIFNTYWAPWSGYIFIPMALMLGFICLAWFYGSFAMDDKVKAWCKSEFAQLLFTIIIGMAVLLIIATLSYIVMQVSSITPDSSHGTGASWSAYVDVRCAPSTLPAYDRPCHIRLAEDYLQILATSSQTQAAAVLRYNSVLAVASSISLSFRGMPDPSGDLALAPLSGLTIPMETLSFVFDLANKNIMALRFQLFLIEFLHLAFFPLFLVMGLFFRTLTFTRRLGGLFIAIALSMYIVYPLMYVFFHSVLFSFTGPWEAPPPGDHDAYLERVGVNLYPINIDLGGVQTSVVQPVVTAPDYSATCGDGYIQPGEECNERDTSIRTDTLKANDQPFGCPPRDTSGNILPGRKNDFNCDFNSCKCVNNTVLLARPSTAYTRDPNGRYVDKFREQYVSTTTRTVALKTGAGLVTNMCLQPPLSDPTAEQAREDESNKLMLGTSKDVLTILAEGWGKAISIALSQDELLGYNGVIDNLGKLLIFGLIAPFLAIMVSLASIKALSPLLGGDVEIAGLTRLI